MSTYGHRHWFIMQVDAIIIFTNNVIISIYFLLYVGGIRKAIKNIVENIKGNLYSS